MGRWHDEPVGPHVQAMYQIAFDTDLFPTLVPFLMMNRMGLTILLHPQSGRPRDDHTINAVWMGQVLPVKTAHPARGTVGWMHAALGHKLARAATRSGHRGSTFIISVIAGKLRGNTNVRARSTAITSLTCATPRSASCRRRCSNSSIAPPRTRSRFATTAPRSSRSSCGIARWSMCPAAPRRPRCSARRSPLPMAIAPTGAAGPVLARGRTGTGQGRGEGEDPVHPGDRRDDLDGEDRPGGEFPAVVPALRLEAARAVLSADRARQEQRVRGADRHHRYDRAAEPRVQRAERLSFCRSRRPCGSPATSCGTRSGSPMC